MPLYNLWKVRDLNLRMAFVDIHARQKTTLQKLYMQIAGILNYQEKLK